MKLLKVKTILASSLLLVTVLLNPTTALGLTLTAPSAPAAPTAPAQPTAPVNLLQDEPVTTTSTPETTASTPTTFENETPTDATNSGNGADSNNDTEVDVNNETQVETVNTADVENNLDVDVNSGNNEANKNMGDGSVTTGDATVDGSLVNDINTTIVNLDDLCGSTCASGGSASNTGNGANSTNNASTSTDSTVDINNQNDLYLVNNENIGTSSGSNDANKNMGDGVIVSGDADVTFTTVNLGNNTGINVDSVTFNVLDNRSEDLLITFPTGGSGSGSGTGAANTGNGSGSDNTAASSAANTTTIDNTNNLILDNNITINADTGNNEADKNMGSGVIESGDANITSNLVNFLNNNIVAGAQWLLATVNIYGDMSGDIILPREVDLGSCGCAADLTASNSGNGTDSTNIANTSANDTTTINSTNNAVVANNISLDANTGGNETSKNMGDSSITTGNVDVNSNLVTVANTNAVGQGDTWWLVIINNQGNHTGKIMGANNGATIAGSGLEFGINPDGTIAALNSGNGADSTNTANTSTNNSTTINNTNNALINNNININANTGNNSASGNMGGADIKTGDVSVASNIVNFINNNFVGKKFVVTFVNIFGSFSGKIVPPNQPLPTVSGMGGPTTAVELSNSTTVSGSDVKASNAKVLSSKNNNVGGSLSQALQEGGKLLENAAITQNKVNDSVKKVINNGTEKSTFQFNFVLLGFALLVLAVYAFVSRRKAS